MAVNTTHFEYAARGRASVYKFRVGADPAIYVWFAEPDGAGQLYTTPRPGPYRADDPLAAAEFPDLDALLLARGTTPLQWKEDLLAQYGERIGWKYP